MSQDCLQTQVNMVSRCLKQSAEEAVRAFDEMFQNDILAIDSLDRDGQNPSPELDKMMAFNDLFFEVVGKPLTDPTRETIDNQVQALTQVVQAFRLYDSEENQFTRIIEHVLTLVERATEKISKEFLKSV